MSIRFWKSYGDKLPESIGRRSKKEGFLRMIFLGGFSHRSALSVKGSGVVLVAVTGTFGFTISE